MTAPLTTPSPYLRDRLLSAATGLRSDGELARLNLAEAEQDVAAARALLDEAEAQQRRAQAEVDSIARGVEWLEREARQLTAEIDADPAAKLRATELMREEPDDPRNRRATCAEMGCTSCLGCDGCPCHTPDAELPGMWERADFRGGATDMDDLTAPGVIDSRHEVARLAGDLPNVAPTTSRDTTPDVAASRVVATHGPTVTMPDTGIGPDPLPPAEPTAEPRHAKPRNSRLTGGFRALGLIRDHGDEQGDT